jgi:hypothetical protein
MSTFAQVENGVVVNVIVAEQDVIDSGIFGTNWIETDINTIANVHYGPDKKPDVGKPLRGNYAGVGYTYDAENDVFYGPQPFPSWTLDTTTWSWQPPTPYPKDGQMYAWNEETQTWDIFK